MINVGVLGLQGSYAEHINILSKFKDVTVTLVKTKDDVDKVDGLIIPGGESTTLGKLLIDFDLKDKLIKRIEKKMPVWGTCAGMILLAKNICDYHKNHLGVMNIHVRRNAYGSQLQSFSTNLNIEHISSKPFKAVFIRAPWIEEVGENVQVLHRLNDRIVAAKQENMLVTSFHPELTDNLDFHKYFLDKYFNTK